MEGIWNFLNLTSLVLTSGQVWTSLPIPEDFIKQVEGMIGVDGVLLLEYKYALIPHEGNEAVIFAEEVAQNDVLTEIIEIPTDAIITPADQDDHVKVVKVDKVHTVSLVFEGDKYSQTDIIQAAEEEKIVTGALQITNDET